MKLVGTDIEGDTQEGKVSTFSINQSAHAIHVLSTSLYQRPIEAIIRELMCNAWDAHKKAGTTDRAVEISLPSYNNNEFKIRDYGTGLAPSEVEGIYTTYFGSTKDQNDDESTGYFGLGSKSPFAHSKEFTVETYWYGSVHKYKAFIDPETQMPAIQKLSVQPTTEDNGFCVTLPHAYESTWSDCAKKVLKAFPESSVKLKPDLFLSWLENEVWYNEEDWMLHKYSTDNQILIGNILYPLDNNIFEKALPIKGAILKCNPSEIDVTPSREQVHYSAKTKKTLERKKDIFLHEIKVEFEKVRDSYKTIWEARTKYPELYSKAGKLLKKEYFFQEPKCLENLVKENGAYDVPKHLQNSVRVYSSSGFSRKVNVENKATVFSLKNNFKIIYPTTQAAVARIKEYLKSRNVTTIIFYASTKEEAQAFAKSLHIPSEWIAPSSDLPEVSVDRKRITGSKSQTLKYIGHRDKAANATAWTEIEPDIINKGGVYVEVSRFKVLFPGNLYEDARSVDEALKLLGHPQLIGVRSSSIQEFDESPKWFTLNEALYNKKRELEIELPLKDLWRTRYTTNHAIQDWAFFYKENRDKLTYESEILKKIYFDSLMQENHSEKLNLYFRIVKYLNATHPYENSKTVSCVKVLAKLHKKYPLLTNHNRFNEKEIVHYINLVDELHSMKGQEQ